MTPRHELPARQRELLGYIAEFVQDGRTPDLRELVRRMAVADFSGLDKSLLPLEKKGYVTIERSSRGRQRRVGFTDLGRMASMAGIPVLGQIPAGPLAEAVEEIEEWIDSTSGFLRSQPGDFVLVVKGDSMVGDGLLSGDRVLLRPGVQINNGEIAAVQIAQDDGTYSGTLKHVLARVNSANLRLRASNPSYEDVVVPAEKVSIAGVYRGMYRPYD